MRVWLGLREYRHLTQGLWVIKLETLHTRVSNPKLTQAKVLVRSPGSHSDRKGSHPRDRASKLRIPSGILWLRQIREETKRQGWERPGVSGFRTLLHCNGERHLSPCCKHIKGPDTSVA